MSDLRELIQKAAGTHGKDFAIILTCSVDSCSSSDLLARRCMVTPINNNIASFPAQLMPDVDDGVLMQPTAGSTVKVLLSGLNAPMVIQFTQIDSISFIAGNKVQLCQGGTSENVGINLQMANQMLSIFNSTQNFATIFQDILTQITTLLTLLGTPSNIDTPMGAETAQFSAVILPQLQIVKTNLQTDAEKLTQLIF